MGVRIVMSLSMKLRILRVSKIIKSLEKEEFRLISVIFDRVCRGYVYTIIYPNINLNINTN